MNCTFLVWRISCNPAINVLLIVRAPRLPPRIRMVFFSGSSPKERIACFCSGFSVNRFWRTGLPVIMILLPGKNFSIPSYATQIFRAFFANSLLVTPAYEFCSCIKVGTPIIPAIFNVGPLAYPPTPTATCGRNWRIMLRAFHWLRANFSNTATFFHKCLRSNPATGNPMIW